MKDQLMQVLLYLPSDSLKCKFQNKIPDFKTWLMEPTAKKGLFADSGRTWHFNAFQRFFAFPAGNNGQIHTNTSTSPWQLVQYISPHRRISSYRFLRLLASSSVKLRDFLGGMYNSDAQHFGGPRRKNKTKKHSC